MKDYDDSGNEYYYYPTIRIEGLAGKHLILSSEHSTVLKNLQIRKCKFDYSPSFSIDTKNCKFSQCVFLDPVSLWRYNNHQGLTFENCFINKQQYALNWRLCLQYFIWSLHNKWNFRYHRQLHELHNNRQP